MHNAITLTKGTQREYLTVGIGGDEIQNARQIVDLSNNTSTLEFDLETASRKWTFFEGMELDAEARGRKYCIWGEDTITKARDNSGTHLHVKLKETWYKLEKKYLTACNINVETSDFDHIDKNMVVLHGNSPDPLYINGTRVTCPYTVGTAQYHFWCLLYGTGWTLDTRYAAYWPDGKFDLESDKKHVLANIDILQKFYGGMLLWDSTNKRVALVDEAKYQVYEGFDIRYRKNIISIERKEDRNIITRLYVYGNSNLNIAAVNGNKEYIDNFSYTGEVLEDVIQNGDIYSQESLLAWGKRESAFYAKPRYTYTVDIFKYRYQEDKAVPQPELAKLAKVVDEDIAGTPTLQRILKIDQNVFVENDCKVVVGDILRTFAGKFKDLNADADKAGKTISGTGQVSGGVVRGKTPALVKTESMLRSEITSVDGNLRSVISQTATSIRTEVSDIEKGLQSTITQTASQIRLEVSDLDKGLRSVISQTADAITARVQSAEGNISSLQITANSITSRVSSLEGYKSTITQTADQISFIVSGTGAGRKVDASVIVSAINGDSKVSIAANRINLTGYVTIDSLGDKGTTTIDGGRITSGIIVGRTIKNQHITMDDNSLTFDSSGSIKIGIGTTVLSFNSSQDFQIGGSDYGGKLRINVREIYIGRDSYAKVGFFGKAPISRITSYSDLTSNASLSTVIARVNFLKNIFKNYGLMAD